MEQYIQSIPADVIFNFNYARYKGGAISSNGSNIAFHGNTTVMFNSNSVNYTTETYNFNNNYNYLSGGAWFLHSSEIEFDGNSVVVFRSNLAGSGKAIYTVNSSIIFDGTSDVVFNFNYARYKAGADPGAGKGRGTNRLSCRWLGK